VHLLSTIEGRGTKNVEFAVQVLFFFSFKEAFYEQKDHGNVIRGRSKACSDVESSDSP
jgi:hypothetical protein